MTTKIGLDIRVVDRKFIERHANYLMSTEIVGPPVKGYDLIVFPLYSWGDVKAGQPVNIGCVVSVRPDPDERGTYRVQTKVFPFDLIVSTAFNICPDQQSVN